MLNLKNIKDAVSIDEKVINVKAWGGEVKIRPLSIAQKSEVIEAMQKGADTSSDIKLANFVEAQVLTAHFALVEPKISIAELRDMPERAFEGVKEICDEVEKLNAKK